MRTDTTANTTFTATVRLPLAPQILAPLIALGLAFAVSNAHAESPATQDGDETATADVEHGRFADIAPATSPLSRQELLAVLGADELTVEQGLEEPLDMDPAAYEAVRSVYTNPGQIPRFKLQLNGEVYQLPLQHTHVRARVSGPVAQVEVTQTYRNPLPHAIETTYVFPLPENSAVDDMRMVVGERVIEAQIKERADAKRTYEAAKREGFTAALLEQERPNVFTQSVANIAPGESIEVVIRYVQNLTYDAGTYEFVFPMVVGPRFTPGIAVGGNPDGTGWARDTTEVGDASRISPPIVGGGQRTGHDISLEIAVDAGVPIERFDVPTHTVAAEQQSDGALEIVLAEQASIPNRDFVLRYEVSGDETAAAVLTHRGARGGFFTLLVQPPDLDLDALVGARELVFVVDVSGSMRGKPLAIAKDAIAQALRRARPVDTFNIIAFASGERMLWEVAHPANEQNIREADAFIDGLQAGGGTLMAGAIDAALGTEVPSDRGRYVFFVTDGLIGNEDRILASSTTYVTALKARGQRARVFGLGVGASPNRFFLDRLAEAGEGATLYASNREDPTRAVDRYFGIIDHPVVEDLSIDWGGLDVVELYPPSVASLLATRPLAISGRYDRGGVATITIRGTADGRPVTMPIQVELPRHEHGSDVLATLWARARVDDLSRDLWDGHDATVVERITEIGLEYHLVTAYTSFVAVDRTRRVGDGDPTHIVQPVDAVEGMSLENVPATTSPQQPAPPSTWGEFNAGSTMAASGDGQLSGRFAVEGDAGSGAGFGGLGSSGSARASGAGVLAEKSVVKPRLKSASPSVSGSLDKRVIQKVIRKHKKEAQACYEAGLLVDPDLHGKIVIRFTINELGHVSSIKISSSTMDDEGVESCLLEAMGRWRFPAPKGGSEVIISYPFIFQTGD